MRVTGLKAILITACLILGFLGGAPTANAQAWPNGYSIRRTIVLNHAKVPNTNQVNFPVLIAGTYADLAATANGGSVTNANGYDIIFTSDPAGSNVLAFEQESYSSTTGQINYWVKIPTLSAAVDTVIFMFYGNSSVTTDQSTKTAVWDSNFVAVWHLPNGTTLTTNDSTSNGNNATNVNSVSASAGEIGGGATFNGSNGMLNAGNGASFHAIPAITSSLWLKTTHLNSTAASNFFDYSSYPNSGYTLADNGQWATSVFFRIYPGGSGGTCSSNGNACFARSLVNDGNWHYVTGVYDPTAAKVYIYLDGVLKDSRTAGTYTANSTANLSLGSFAGGAGSSNADEFRISKTVRSADWIATEYNTASNPSTFFSIGAATSQSSSAPVITSLSLAYGSGVSVTVSGLRFGSAQGSSTMTINGVAVATTSWSDTGITAPAPFGVAGSSTTIVVTVGGVQSNAVSFTPQPQTLQSPWLDQDIGTVAFAGSAKYVNDVFSMTASGASTVGTADGLHFAYQTLSGDGTITARVLSSQGDFYGSAVAGVMIRESLSPGSTYAFTMYMNPLPYLQFRATTGASGTRTQLTGQNLPYWLKLVRTGNTFTPYTSPDGIHWTQGASQTISMATSVYIGLALSNQSNTGLASATFDNVSVSSSSSPAPAITNVSETTGSVGSQAVISGSGFGTSQNGSIATLNGTQLIINAWSNTAITITIPVGATSGRMKVTVAPSMNDSNSIWFTVESNSLPTGWLDIDVGIQNPQGSASYSNGVFTVIGASNGVGSTADAFHFAYQMLSGDGSITARVVSVPNTGGTISAGVMLRETLDPGSTNAFGYYYNFNVNDHLSVRTTTGGSTSSQALTGSQNLPYWLQLVRSGNTFTMYSSADGSHWTQVGSAQTFTMATTVYVGLGIGVFNGTSASATFDNVTITPVSGPQTPVVTSISPNAALVGTSVTINGANFGLTQSTSTVTFSGVTATPTSWTTSSITVPVPNGAITGNVVVTIGGFSTPGVNFTVLKMPTISSLSPTSGGYGTSVTITGTNYGATQGTSVVSFNGTNATSITSWTDTQIVASVPTGATTGPVTVTVNTVTSTTHPTFTIYNPVITSITPPAAPPGGKVVLNGTGFLGNYANTPVSFNGTMAYSSNWTDTTITIFVPAAATSGPVNATVEGITSNSVQFSVIESLAITSISPTTGAVGSSVTITGVGFGPAQSNSTVDFYGLTPTVTSWSDTQIVVTVPRWTTSGPINVGVAGGMYSSQIFSPTFTAVVTDSLGNSSTYVSQDIGGQFQMLSSTGSGCSSCTVRGVVTASYDSNGNSLTTTDELGHTTTRTYDTNNNVLTVSQPLNSSTTATTTYTYNSLGEVLTATDPLGNVTTNTYDANGNLLTVTSPAPASGVAASVTHFAYNSLGQLTQISDPLGHVSTMTYTTAGLIATITDAQSNVTTYAYDAHGNRTSVTDALGNVTTFAYDAGDRLITITYPPAQSGGSTSTSRFTYDSRGRRTSATDQNGKVTSYAYDTADRLTTVTDAAGNVTTYSYDTENNLLGITDANSHTTNFTYDAFGRVTQTTFPSSFYESYAYDAIGNLTSKTDRKGQTIQYVYDALNRLTQKSYPDSTSAAYTYDLASRIQQVNDPTGTYAFAYDNMGRLIGTTTNYSFLSGTTFTNAYTYDANSNRIGYTAPDGSTNTYTYDTLNRLTTLANSWAGSFNFSYDTLNRRTQMTRPNGVNTNYAYDSLSRLLSVLHQNGASTIDGASYTVDAAGNRASKTDQMAGVTSNYAYDAIYQLTQVTQAANTTESYTYDPVGNRLSSLTAATSSYNASNQLNSSSNATYTYDANGNTTSKTDSTGTTTYAWDFENRLTGVTLPGTGGTVSFKYDPSGRRIQKALTQSAGNVVTNYVYDGDSISETADASGTVTARYSQGQGIDEPLAAQNGGTVGYYHADGLGSVTSMTNASGALIQNYAYDSFGRQSSSTGSLQNPFQYTAREMDGETGLYYYRARYYDSQAGRFLNEDPSGFSSGENFYSYVDNDSVEFADPEGLCPLDDKKKHCPAKMPKNPRRRIMVQTLMGEMTGEGYVGSNQYADSQSGPTKATGEPDGPEITNETLDLEAELLAGTMLNLGKIGNTGTYRGLPAGQNLATKGLRSPDGSDLCIMLQRAIGAVNEAVDSPVPLSPFNHWKTSRQGNWVRPLDLSKTPALRIALTDFYY